MADAPELTTAWLTLKQAAAHLACSPSYLGRQARFGKIRAYKVGKLWRFAVADADEFVRRSAQPLPIPFVPRREVGR